MMCDAMSLREGVSVLESLSREPATPATSDPSVVVLGGACVCFAKGRVDRLTLQDLIDCLVPFRISARMNASVILYVQHHESRLLGRALGYEVPTSATEDMTRALLEGVRAMLASINEPMPKFQVLDTGRLDIVRLVDLHAARIKERLPKELLYGLYDSSAARRQFPRETNSEPIFLHIYRRNMALYSRDFLLDTGLVNSRQQFLFVENSTQAKALRLAKMFNTHAAAWVYPATVNRQGKEMCMGNRNHKIELRSTPSQTSLRSQELEAINSTSRDFFLPVLGGQSIERSMEIWRRSVWP